jgi:hypothetical protein
VLLLGGEGEGERQSKKALSPREDPCSPLYQTKGAGNISEEREREGEVVHAQQDFFIYLIYHDFAKKYGPAQI